MQRTLRLLIATVLLASATILVKGYRTYRHHQAEYHPSRGPIARPVNLPQVAEDVTWTTPRGTLVSAWYLPPHNGAAVIAVHGSPGDRRDLLPDVLALAKYGYGAVLLDLPGHGASGGTTHWGLDEQAAVEGAVDLAVRRGSRVAILAFSDGTSVAAHVAAHDARIRATVLTGCFTDARTQIRHSWSSWGPITQWPALWSAEREGIELDQLDNTGVIGLIAPRAVRMVGGSADRSVSPDMVRALYALAGDPKEIEIVAGATHGTYGAVGGAPYYERTRQFLDRALGVASPAP